MLAFNKALLWQTPTQANAICLCLSEVINQIPKLGHGTDGFIYTKVEAPYTDDAMCVHLNHYPDSPPLGVISDGCGTD
jgi:hypothetical protein